MREYLDIRASSLSKKFVHHTVFRDIGFSICTGQSLAVTGPNGSGKSTLLEIIAGIQPPASGRIEFFYNDILIRQKDAAGHIGFISPKINPYKELTGIENIMFAAKSRGLKDIDIDESFRRFDLLKHKDKRVLHYSTGMKQRLKFMLAVIHDPGILILDEPGSNLDKNGKDIIYSSLEGCRGEKIIIIATNDEYEAKLCGKRISLD